MILPNLIKPKQCVSTHSKAWRCHARVTTTRSPWRAPVACALRLRQRQSVSRTQLSQQPQSVKSSPLAGPEGEEEHNLEAGAIKYACWHLWFHLRSAKHAYLQEVVREQHQQTFKHHTKASYHEAPMRSRLQEMHQLQVSLI
jgi:hypothetical protein